MATRRQALGVLTGAAGLSFWGAGAEAAGADEVIVPFELTHDRAWTIVKFNGHGWYKLIIDTGADKFSLDDKICKEIGLTRRSSDEMIGATGAAYMNTYLAQTVSIANVVSDPNALVIGLNGGLEDGLQGLIPGALLDNVLFDFVQKRMHLSHKRPSGLQGFSVVPYVKLGNGSSGSMSHVRETSPFPYVRAEVDGRPVTLRVDTGAPEAAYLYASYVDRAGLWDKYKGARETQVGGITSHVSAARLVKAESLKLGDIVFAAPRIALQDPKDKAINDYDMNGEAYIDGLIGIESLRRLDLAIVPSEGCLYVRKNAMFDDVQRINRAGLIVRSVNDKPTAVWVYQGGPAWAAGIREGDIINGYAGGDGTIAGLDWKLSGPPGDQIDLQFTHDGQSKQVSFKLVEAE
ncbi:MAG TPA: aspartyl protease family protein [Caulobacteraceae bacterium]|jgi:predicted aspartyl protease